jgi:PAS domain S-box-containing protein
MMDKQLSKQKKARSDSIGATRKKSFQSGLINSEGDGLPAESIALQESEKRLRQIIDLVPHFIFAKDIQGRFLLVNKTLADAYSTTPDNMIGKTDMDFELSAEEFRNFHQDDKDVIQTGKPKVIEEEKFTDTKGNVGFFSTIKIPFTSSGNNLPSVLCVSVNITEKKKAELKLKEQHEEFESFFNCSLDLLCIANTDGYFLRLNKEWENTLGYALADIEGKRFLDFVHPDDLQDTLEAMEKLSRQIKVLNFTNRYLCKDKTYKWIEWRSFPAGNRIFAAARDITERIRIEKELIAAKEKAEESDRLKTAFLQNMSHEIRTPLNAICGFSDLLNDQELNSDKLNAYVTIIKNSSNHLLSVVNNILTISSLETGQEKVIIEAVCVNDIILDLLTIFKQQTVNRNISVFAKQPLSDRESEIFTDRTKITQVLNNLLSNALKFTHQGTIEFGYGLRNHELLFYVKDTGIGIDPEYHEKIFGRFQQANESGTGNYEGTGLGLSISKGFVEILGGKIWVDSKPGHGATFRFTVPYKPVHPEGTYLTNPAKEYSGTILVAEDEEFNYLLIEEFLKSKDFRLLHTKNGDETVNLCRENPSIDLVIMDIKMPVMDGYTATKMIREFRPDLPVVALSAYALEHEREKYGAVFNHYLAKPVLKADLLKTVLHYMSKDDTL